MADSSTLLKDFLTVIGEIASPSLAEPWDNVGLMVGDPNSEVKGILVALDASEEVLAEAREYGCNVVLTHHPLIFKPLSAIRVDRVIDRLLARALIEGIAVVSCHTNLDKVSGGVNDALADSLGLANCLVLAEEYEGRRGVGFGRVGRFNAPVTFADFTENLLNVLDLDAVKVAGPAPEEVSTVALCGGSGSDLAEIAETSGADVFVTGEIKHSAARWAEDAGFCLIDAGHFATERSIVPVLAELLDKIHKERGWKFEVRGTARQSNPFRYYFRK